MGQGAHYVGKLSQLLYKKNTHHCSHCDRGSPVTLGGPSEARHSLVKYKTQLSAKASIPEYMCIYISVAKPYGRFGQKLETLQAGQERTGQERTGQGKTWQGRAGQGDISKADRAKAEQGVGKKQGRA